MDIVYLICFFILGSILGSFFCCVGIRLSNDESFIKGRSKCDKCNTLLKWYDLIPLISYITLRGRCRYCENKISILNLFIELVTGILFSLSYYSFGFSLDLLLSISLVSMSMIIFSSDITYMIIPDQVLIFFGIIILFIQYFRVGFNGLINCIISGLLLFFFMFLLMKLGEKLFKKESLGGGDVKLLFVLGLILDPFLTLISIFLASFIALPISLYLLFKNKEHMIPFGPFLLIGFLIVYFTKLTATDVFSFFLF